MLFEQTIEMRKATGTSCDGQLYKNRTHHHMSPETNVAAARTVTIELRDSTTNPTIKQFSTQRPPIARTPAAQQLAIDRFEAWRNK